MKTLQKLKEREQELLNELSTYRWWGNEDDEEFDEYGREHRMFEPIQREYDKVRDEIFKLKNK